MIIGTFRKIAGLRGCFGSITTLAFTMCCVGIVPVEEETEGGPHYIVEASVAGERVDIGAAFRVIGESGAYLGVILDSPGFASPINAALHYDADSDEAVLVWLRPDVA